MNTPSEWRHLEFAQIISCTRCNLATDQNLLRDGGENVPQPGYIGHNFRISRVLLVGQNPGSASKSLVVPDRKYTAALRALRDEPTPERYRELSTVLREFMPRWPFLKPYARLLKASRLSLDDISYCNVVRCRTADGKVPPGDLVAKQCVETHFTRWLDRLSPRVVVFLGKWGWNQGRNAVAAKGIPCAYINRQRSLTDTERAANEKQVLELILKHRG